MHLQCVYIGTQNKMYVFLHDSRSIYTIIKKWLTKGIKLSCYVSVVQSVYQKVDFIDVDIFT